MTDIHELLRLEREKVAKLDKQVARLAREVKKTFDTCADWWQHGVDRGWCSEVVCATHDGFSELLWTKEELDEWEAGYDPCLPVVRVDGVDRGWVEPGEGAFRVG